MNKRVVKKRYEKRKCKARKKKGEIRLHTSGAGNIGENLTIPFNGAPKTPMMFYDRLHTV